MRLLLSWPYTSIEPNDRNLRADLRSREWVIGPELPEMLRSSPRPAVGNIVVREKEAHVASDELKNQLKLMLPHQ